MMASTVMRKAIALIVAVSSLVLVCGLADATATNLSRASASTSRVKMQECKITDLNFHRGSVQRGSEFAGFEVRVEKRSTGKCLLPPHLSVTRMSKHFKLVTDQLYRKS